MYILEGIVKAIALVVLVVIFILLAKKPTVENKFTMRNCFDYLHNNNASVF